MAVRLVQSKSSQALWDSCSNRFLDELGSNTGPGGFQSHLWITHQNLRDRLFERAFDRGMRGWLGPPISFFSDLPKRFGIRRNTVGTITRRGLIGQLAAERGRKIFGRRPGNTDGLVRGHMLDVLFEDLLPEGVLPEQLVEILAELDGDEFVRQRNEWIVQVYAAYLEELEKRGVYDRRSLHALIADKIQSGELKSALGGVGRLHVYGIYTLQKRRRMFEALAGQEEVEVILYVAEEPEESEFEELAAAVESVDCGQGGGVAEQAPFVQPAPDITRELNWVAREVKQLLLGGEAAPHEIAIVSRSGREDTNLTCRVLGDAGVAFTARIRTPLTQVPILKAILSIFRAAESEWSYRHLRSVLDNPYLGVELDLQTIDRTAQDKRIESLEQWEVGLSQLLAQRENDQENAGYETDTLVPTLAKFKEFRTQVEELDTPHTEAEWIDITLGLAENKTFNLRGRLTESIDDRWDIVRSDQRALLQFENLLKEWGQLEHGRRRFGIEEWYRRLHRVLEADELVVPTPMQKGVQVQEADDAALVPFRHTFVIHANDDEFPRTPKPDGLFLDEERRVLRHLGLPLADEEEILRRERSLWRAVTLGTDTRISYRTTHQHDGKIDPLLPSLMVPSHEPAKHVLRPRTVKELVQTYKDPINDEQANELAALKLADQLAGKSKVVRVTVEPANRSLLEQAIVSSVAEAHRDTGGPQDDRDPSVFTPNPWNGEIRDPEVLGRLTSRFGVDYPWSAGQLEQYSTCPFAFFVERVLRLSESQEADDQLSTLNFGRIAHDLLERFYRAHEDGLPVFLDGETLKTYERIAEETFTQYEEMGERLGVPTLWAVTRRSVRDCVRSYIEWELEYLDETGEVPQHIEHEFGFHAPVVIHGTNLKGDQVSLRIRGRIDRLDSDGDGDQVKYHVLDYKLNTIPKMAGYQDGSVLQGPLYLCAIEESGLTAGKCRYRRITKPGVTKNSAQIIVGSAAFERALEIAFSIPGRVRAGLFEASLAANARGWPSFYPGRDICRSQARLRVGNRFDG